MSYLPKVIVAKAGSIQGTEKEINFIDGSGATVTVADNPGNNRVDVTITAIGSGGVITSINTDATPAQVIDVGTSGSDFAISNNGTGTHTLNLPTASASARGALSTTDWSTFNGKESALTFSTGTTRSTNTITANLSTGVSGGQSVVGGTASGNALTLSSTSNGTKGNIVLGTSAYDEVNNRLGLATTAPTHSLTIASAGNGEAIYNTTDQTTNFERGTLTFGSNVLILNSEKGGTGTSRPIRIVHTVSGASCQLDMAGTTLPFKFTSNSLSITASPFNQFTSSGTGNNASSGTQTFLSVTPTWNQTSTAAATDFLINRTQTGIGSGAQLFMDCQVAGSSKFKIDNAGHPTLDATNTAGGTTGNQTINKPSGTVNIAATGTTVTVTNSLCTTSSIVFAVIRTNDSTATIKNVVPGSGSFVINLTAAATAETSIGFLVIN